MKTMLRSEELIVYLETINKFVNFPKSHPKYGQVYEFLVTKPNDEDGFLDLFLEVAAEAIEKYSNGSISSREDGVAVFDGLELPADVLSKIKELRDTGYSWGQHQKFWARCLLNPRRESVKDLFRFISNHNLTITTEGKFLAYKAITGDFKDKHTNRIDNYPGCVVTMDRDKVAFDPNTACGSGLHVSNLRYAKGFASCNDIIVLVEVDPADVVSVPYDSNAEKIRTCRYKVLRIWNETEELETSIVDVESSNKVAGDSYVEERVKGGDCYECDREDDDWTEVEDAILIGAVEKRGYDWDYISDTFFNNTRDPEECENRYNEIY